MNQLRINEKELIENIEILKNSTDQKLIGVVKGNGYGFGLRYMAGLLKEQGIEMLAVTELSDLLKLRRWGIGGDILLLKPVVTLEDAEKLYRAGGIGTVASLENARLLAGLVKEKLEAWKDGQKGGSEKINQTEPESSQGAQTDRQAAKAPKKLRVHIKINTGLNRFGFDEDRIKNAQKLKKIGKGLLSYEGIYTHFNNAFTDNETTLKEYQQLRDAAADFEKLGFSFKEIHCADTSAFMNLKDQLEEGMTAVRIGSGWSGRAISNSRIRLHKVGLFESRVLEVRSVEKGAPIGYSGAYKAKGPMQIAIVDAGYDDGVGKHVENGVTTEKVFWREWLSVVKQHLKKNDQTVQIQGRDCRILGYPGMTNLCVDVTGLDVESGDEVLIDMAPIHVNPLLPRIIESGEEEDT